MTSNVKKIAVVIPRYGLLGGAEKFVLELTERIALNERYEIHVFANKWTSLSNQITFHKVPVITFPKFLTSISFAWFAGLKIAKMKFDLIHSHDRIFDADIFTMHGIPHRVWVHDIRKKHMSLFDYGTSWVEKSLANNKRCKRFLSVSNLTKEIFLQEYRVAPERVQVIHPGVDIEKFQKLDRQRCRREIREHFDLNPSDTVILFVSMNFDIKGLDSLVSAVAKAKSKSKHPSEKLKLLVVGKGNYKKYGSLAQKLGIKDDVIFAGVRKENLEQIYMACDIFSILSKFDTFGITVLEAMAASLPVIISGNVGAKDLVREGINGFVIENTGNADKISDKIGFMLNEENRTRMAKEACSTARSNTWEAAAKRVEDIYERLLD